MDKFPTSMDPAKGHRSMVTDDPFAELFPPILPAQRQIYISGRLTLLSLPPGTTGEWICLGYLSSSPHWHRRLDAHAFLWLRNRVNAAIEFGKLSSDFQDALATLEWIAAVGIAHGAFTADDIAPGLQAPVDYEFTAGLPRWVDDIGPDFLPPAKQSSRQPLTAR